MNRPTSKAARRIAAGLISALVLSVCSLIVGTEAAAAPADGSPRPRTVIVPLVVVDQHGRPLGANSGVFACPWENGEVNCDHSSTPTPIAPGSPSCAWHVASATT
jgi:hypothetical protein